MFPLKLQKISCYLGYAAKYSWHISWRIFYFWLVCLVNLNTGSQLPQFTCFVCAKMINLLNLNWSSENFVIIAKGFLKLPNLHMLIKQKSPSLPRNFSVRIFGKLPIIFLTEVNLLYLPYSMTKRCCLLHLRKLFAEHISKNSDLDDSGISSPVFFSRTNLELYNISITPKKVKKLKMNLDLSKASGPDCIAVVVLKNCEL